MCGTTNHPVCADVQLLTEVVRVWGKWLRAINGVVADAAPRRLPRNQPWNGVALRGGAGDAEAEGECGGEGARPESRLATPWPLAAWFLARHFSTWRWGASAGRRRGLLSEPIWYAGPDLAAATLFGSNPKIIRAFKFVPRGIQPGLKSVSIGSRVINPENDDFFLAICTVCGWVHPAGPSSKEDHTSARSRGISGARILARHMIATFSPPRLK
jgi:hypothetical protein